MRLIQLGSKSLLASTILALSACGGSGGSSNSAPQFAQGSFAYSLAEDTPFTAQLSASDSDGDRLAYRVQQSPANGTLSVTATGSFTYTPNANINGNDTATVVVSDNADEATATLNFTISAVNDAPEFGATSVTVNELGELQGQVVATDVDSDQLTYRLVSQAATGDLTFNADGSFKATVAGGNFRVAVSDGSAAEVERDITLAPSYSGSDNRRQYYYSSTQSHLRDAENLIVSNSADDALQVRDAAQADNAYVELAVGYALAGFPERAKTIIDSEINNLLAKGNAYRKSAVALDRIKNTAVANELRLLASANYNKALADVGFDNISSEQASAYRGLANDYRDAKQHPQAAQLLNQVEGFADELAKRLAQDSGNADNSFGRVAEHSALIGILEAFALDSVFGYLKDPANQDFDAALAAVDRMANNAGKHGYWDFRGTRYERNSVQSTYDAATLYYLLSLPDNNPLAITKAKQATAQAFAYYAEADYDVNHKVSVDDKADATLARYRFGLDRIAALYAALYPNKITVDDDGVISGNVAIDLLRTKAKRRDNQLAHTYRQTLAYWVFADSAGDADITAKLAPISNYFSKTYTSSARFDRHWDTLIEYSTQDRTVTSIGLHSLLKLAGGRTAHQQQVLQAALTLNESDGYIQANKTTINDALASSGCLRSSELLGALNGKTAQAGVISRCQTIADDLFLPADGKVVVLSRAVDATEALMTAWSEVGNSVNANAVADRLIPELAAMARDDDDDLEDYLEAHFDIANSLVAIGNLSKAQTVMSQALTQAGGIITDDNNNEATQLGFINATFKALALVAERQDTKGRYPYLHAIRHHAGRHAEYSSSLKTQTSAVLALLQSIQQQAAGFAAGSKQGVFEKLIDQYTLIGDFERATTAMQDDVVATASYDEILVSVSKAQSTQDDFPSFAIANVDTDLDGLPNFFLPEATEQAIEASKLILDSDDDADGIVNTEDITPLIANL
ncbi:cadherin-like domain-containing protein [Bacterioplanoides sp.]|uniref:cadherin-like domain-containing protein n=1 Tax=Bacterioplanoides sp. TaxID=2066072 RepID=UPI003B5BA4BD